MCVCLRVFFLYLSVGTLLSFVCLWECFWYFYVCGNTFNIWHLWKRFWYVFISGNAVWISLWEHFWYRPVCWNGYEYCLSVGTVLMFGGLWNAFHMCLSMGTHLLSAGTLSKSICLCECFRYLSVCKNTICMSGTLSLLICMLGTLVTNMSVGNTFKNFLCANEHF